MAALTTEPSTRLRGDDSDIGAIDNAIGATEGGREALDARNS
jgi:hypothetical protein